MQTDLIGKVNNVTLSSRQGLFPLFEAVVNSIDAINDSDNPGGNIRVVVHRDTGVLALDEEQFKIAPIIGFDVIDSGIGFDSGNYKSFNTAESTRKMSAGGKGVGRFVWLKAFDSVHIESRFKENGQTLSRVFDFVLSNEEPIQNHVLTQDGIVVRTKVSLQSMKEKYASNVPLRLDAIANRIVEHFLEYFVLRRMPDILLEDKFESIDLKQLYFERVSNEEKCVFKIDEHEFTLFHFLLVARAETAHRVNFCARHSVVTSVKLNSKNVPNLPSRIQEVEGNGLLVYMGYLSSLFLDSHVDNQRTGFTVFAEGQMRYLGEVLWSEIEDQTIKEVRSYLAPITAPIRVDKEEKIQDFVYNNAPQYRSVLKHHPDALDQIPPDLSGVKLEVELFKVKRQVEEQLREKADAILNASNEKLLDPDDEINQKYDKFLEEWNDFSKAALAEYVVQRRKTLALLKRYMEMGEDMKFAQESAIHKLIFPIRSTSDDIDYEQQNLWIIDERLSFHRYLSSDKPLTQVEPIESDYSDRPDLLFFFDRPIAVIESQPKDSVTVFEFKRPMREDSDPVEQMNLYVKKMREGKIQTNKGRAIYIDETTPFYCYAICDLTEKQRDRFTYTHKMIKTPDGEGYFSFHPALNAYVEVIGYDKLLRDAELRNRILFDQMNIHD